MSVCGDAELVTIGSGLSPRKELAIKTTLSEHQENARSRRDGTRLAEYSRMRAVPWSPDGTDGALDIQLEMERPAETVPRDPGEVLVENKVARTCFRRADFEEWLSQ